jgi:prevent-host-death family protein
MAKIDMAKPSTWSLHDAKNRFSAVVEAAQRRGPQTVTKHGKPAVVVVDAGSYAQWEHLEPLQSPSFVDHLLAVPKDDGAFERLEAGLREP